MADYKITKNDEYVAYAAPGHNDCKLCRLHAPNDVDDGSVMLVRAHFLPSGGGIETTDNPFDSLYYTLSGTMLFEGDNGVEAVLEAGDSVHVAPNAKKTLTNIGPDTAQVLVILVPNF